MEEALQQGLALIIIIVVYAYAAYVLQVIARKTGNQPRGWWAWVPVLNIFLAIRIAQKAYWWIIPLLIPGVDVIFAIVLWAEIAERRGKKPWIAIFMIVPIINFAIMGYIAFSDTVTIKEDKPPSFGP